MPKDKDEERSACSNFGLRVRAVLILAGLTVLGHVQQENDRAIGETMVYQTMLDEIDEGTAIFKCTNNPPVGKSRFLSFDGLPSAHYLWLTGQGGRLIRGGIEPSEALPTRR